MGYLPAHTRLQHWHHVHFNTRCHGLLERQTRLRTPNLILSPLLQHFRYTALLSGTLPPPNTDPVGTWTRQHDGRVPVVCHRLPHRVLRMPSDSRVRFVVGRLARVRRCCGAASVSGLAGRVSDVATTRAS